MTSQNFSLFFHSLQQNCLDNLTFLWWGKNLRHRWHILSDCNGEHMSKREREREILQMTEIWALVTKLLCHHCHNCKWSMSKAVAIQGPYQYLSLWISCTFPSSTIKHQRCCNQSFRRDLWNPQQTSQPTTR